MAYLFASNDKSDWTGPPLTDTGSGLFDSARVPYALEVVDFGTMGLIGNHPAPSSTVTWYHWRQWSIAATGSSEDGSWITVKDAAGLIVCKLELFNGLIGVGVSGNGTSWTVGTYSTAFTASAIQIFDLKIEVDGSNVKATLWVDGVAHASGIQTITNSASLGVARHFAFTLDDALASGIPLYVSEFIVADHDPTGARLNRLSPTTAGAHTDWTGAVADLADDDASTGMTAATTADRNSSNVGAYGGGSVIEAVLAVGHMSKGASGLANAQQFLRKGAVDYDGSSTAVPAVAGFLTEVWTLDPLDSTAWTAADLSGIEVGVEALT